MSVDYKKVKLSDLHEDPANARLHPDENLADIRASLKEFGQVEPLVVQKASGKVIGGNGRLKVMRELGWTDCDVAYVEFDNMKSTALGIALNRAGERAEWDKETLDKLLGEIDGISEELEQSLLELEEEIRSQQIDMDVEDPPESVQENLDQLEDIKRQRKEDNEGVISKTDTEKYLIIVYPSREAEEQQLKQLGLPYDERYIPANSIRLRPIGKIKPLQAERPIKSAESKKAGATG